MTPLDPQVHEADQVLGAAQAALPHAAAYQALPLATQGSLADKLSRVRSALAGGAQAFAMPADPYTTGALEPQARAFTGGPFGNLAGGDAGGNAADAAAPANGATGQKSLLRAINDLPAATGNMMDELGFADFVASLVHGTFDAIADSTIRQMESFAKLVGSLAQTVEDFSRDNVSPNQVRDWLIERHPRDLALILPQAADEQPRLVPRASGEDTWGASPTWLKDYGFEGETLSEEFIETQLVPQARLAVGQDRMRTLASMALLGMQRVAVERGEIAAKIRIRAKATDRARVDFAQAQDPAAQQSTWGARGGFSAPSAQAMVSTSVNAQSDAAIAAELQGEVKIVFRSDALPLESFVNDAQRVLLERAARRPGTDQGAVPVQNTRVQSGPAQVAAQVNLAPGGTLDQDSDPATGGGA